MPRIRQTSFSSGELAPEYWGRTDLDKYASGLRFMRNFFTSKHGAAVSRPGTEIIWSFRPVVGGTNYRLVPFLYTPESSYVLCFFAGYFSVFFQGEVVLEPSTTCRLRFQNLVGAATILPGTELESASLAATATVMYSLGNVGPPGTVDLIVKDVVGTFLDTESFHDVGATFTADTVEDTGPGDNEVDVALEVESPFVSNELASLQWAQSGDTIILTVPSHAPVEIRRYGADDWRITDFSTKRQKGFGTTSSSGGAYLFAPPPAADATHPATNWSWAVTVIYRTPDGVLTETPAFIIDHTVTAYPATGVAVGPTKLPVSYPDRPATIILPMPAGASPQSAPSGLSTVNPLIGRPVAVAIYRGRGESYGWVGEVAWLEQSFVDLGQAPNYARPPPRGKNPFEVYDTATPPVLVRTEEPAAVAYFEDRLCFGGTDERPDLFIASQAGDYRNFDEHLVLLAEDALEFTLASRKRSAIRSFLPLGRLLAFTSTTVWAIRGQEGSPLQFDTIDAKVVEEVGASTMSPVSVEGVALYERAKGAGVRALVPDNVPGGYTGVDISALADHLFTGSSLVDWTYAQDPWGVVWAVRGDGTLLSLTYLKAQQTWAWALHVSGSYTNDRADGFQQASYKSICSVPEDSEDAVYVMVTRQGGVTALERFVSRVETGTVADGRMGLDASIRCTGAPNDNTLVNADLSRFFGYEVYAVVSALDADGAYTSYAFGPLFVEGVSFDTLVLPVENVDTRLGGISGTLTVDVGYYNPAKLETLDVATTQARVKQKRVTAVGFEVKEGNVAGLTAGPDLDNLRPAKFDQGLITANIMGGYDKLGRAALLQTLPLPTTVLGVTREVDLGD
jgi:hypothetical protein